MTISTITKPVFESGGTRHCRAGDSRTNSRWSSKPLLNWTFHRLPHPREFIVTRPRVRGRFVYRDALTIGMRNRDQELRMLTPELVAWLATEFNARRALDTLQLCGFPEKTSPRFNTYENCGKNMERRLRNDLRSL